MNDLDLIQPILKEVADACSSLDIDFFIIGAVARNLWYGADAAKYARGTEDVDVAVYVPDHKTYDQLKESLIEQVNYIAVTDNAFGLDTPTGQRVDLIPFGEISEYGEVTIEGQSMTSIRLDGLEDVYLHGRAIATVNDVPYNTCSIAGIIILKLIAYDDRPDRRIKDIKDIAAICEHYPEIETEDIWEHHNDLYGGDRSHHEVGMIALGRLMAQITNANESLHNRIIRILNAAIQDESQILRHMITDPLEETLDQKARILSLIRQGLSEHQ